MLRSEKPWKKAVDDKQAVVLPPKHCAFIGCAWEGSIDDELYQHLAQVHMHVLADAMDLLPSCFSADERMRSVYHEGIAEKTRFGPPLATYSIDRRCLRSYHAATKRRCD